MPSALEIAFLALAGVLLVVGMLLRGEAGQKPVHFAIKRPVELELKSDRRTFTLLLGVVSAGGALFLTSRGYESRLGRLQGELQTKDSEIDVLRRQIDDRAIVEDFTVVLSFPAPFEGSRWQVQTALDRPTGPEMLNVSPLVDPVDRRLVRLKFPRLLRSDTLRVVVSDAADPRPAVNREVRPHEASITVEVPPSQ